MAAKARGGRKVVILAVCLIFCLLMGTNVVWFQKSMAEKKLQETDRRAADLQAQLDAERLKSSTLEMKMKIMTVEATAPAHHVTPKPFVYPNPTHEAKQPPPATRAKPPSPARPADESSQPKGEAKQAERNPVPPPAEEQAQAGEAPAGGGGGGGGGKHCTVPVVVMACNRPGYLERTLTALKQRMPSSLPAGQGGGTVSFEVVVSQDGGMKGVGDLMRSKFPRIRYMQHLDDSPVEKQNPGEQESYYRIARHYGWALGKVFEDEAVEWAVILEDDLEVAPDFFHYMAAGADLLRRDPTLWTVTAWNDNGLPHLVADPEAVYRSDFMSGLGWIMTRKLWEELGPKWPKAYWDDWMREPPQRKGRSCLRPEVPRTVTFGQIGSSQGQFFTTHLSKMQLNTKLVDFTARDMSHLVKDAYDPPFLGRVAAAPEVQVGKKFEGDGKILYSDYNDFRGKAKSLGIMDDEKAGVPRTAYLGVVTVNEGGRHVYVAPAGGKPMYKD